MAFRATLIEKPAALQSFAELSSDSGQRPLAVDRMTPTATSPSRNGITDAEIHRVENAQNANTTSDSFGGERSFREYATTDEDGSARERGGREQDQARRDQEIAALERVPSMPAVRLSAPVLEGVAIGQHRGAMPSPQASGSAPAASEAEAVTPAPQSPQTRPAEIAVRVTRPDAHPVDVQIRQRAGEIHVAVRTPDGGLQKSLRDGLPDLVDSLDRAGFQAQSLTSGPTDLPHALAHSIAGAADNWSGTPQDSPSRDDLERNAQRTASQGGESSGKNSRDARERFAWNWQQQMED
ncbi:MAG: flagellar hook-length control protein FliK [Bryobacteraceae bacterium]